MRDLFGNQHPEPASKAPVSSPNLFDATAERKALETGRPVSQERTEILHPDTARSSEGG